MKVCIKLLIFCFLISKTIYIQVDSFNSNALWWAAERGHVEVANYLKSKGAKPVKPQNVGDDESSGSGGECFLGGLSDSE